MSALYLNINENIILCDCSQQLFLIIVKNWKHLNDQQVMNGYKINNNGTAIQWNTSVQFSCLVVSYSLQPQGLQHACPSPIPEACSDSCPSSR